jgi:NADPH-dependent 2,4-dienoyl-CoA reductase/sulfur reductase-like enzyme
MQASAKPAGVVVVGGGLAGARTAQQLRRSGFEGSIVLISEEKHPPYDRPPLSKAVLVGKRNDSPLRFDPAALGITLRTDTRAESLDVAEQVVYTTRGPEPFSQLVIATGAKPMRVPGDGVQLTLRTIDDALALRERLTPGARVVVIGASWIGAEVCWAAVQRGCHVACVEVGPAPLSGALGAEAGARFLPWWGDIDLRLNAKAREITRDTVVLTDGQCLQADVVVTGIGVGADTDWLAGSGVELDRGVRVDQYLRTSARNVLALGDATARWSPRYQRVTRVQHWDLAARASAVAAANLLARSETDLEPFDPIPYFWSDQFGHKIQYVGHCAPHDTLVWCPADPAPGMTAMWVSDAGVITAVLTADRPRESAAGQRLIAAGGAGAVQALAAGEITLTRAVEGIEE